MSAGSINYRNLLKQAQGLELFCGNLKKQVNAVIEAFQALKARIIIQDLSKRPKEADIRAILSSMP